MLMAHAILSVVCALNLNMLTANAGIFDNFNSFIQLSPYKQTLDNNLLLNRINLFTDDGFMNYNF